MKITSVEVQKSNAKRYNIFLDGQFAFGADEDTVVKFRLVVGKVVEQIELDKILLETEVGKLMGRMYNLLTIRMRSEKEVRDYLRNLNFKRSLPFINAKGKKKFQDQEEISGVVVELLIQNLKNKGLLDDEKFTRDWVEARRRRHKGMVAIKQELYQKGISREIVEKVIGDGLWEMGEGEIAKQALEKKLKAFKNLPEVEFRKKSIEFLMRRGFESSVAKEVVAKFLQKE